MHSMVIILLIKTIQKKSKNKKKAIPLALFCCFSFVSHILMWSIAVPVANDVAQLACLLRCLPPEQYMVYKFQQKRPYLKSWHRSAWIRWLYCINKADLLMCNVLLWPPLILQPTSAHAPVLMLTFWATTTLHIWKISWLYIKKKNNKHLFSLWPMCIWAADAEIKICVT